ncbi:PQQ-binding-like beta-propeller repeat protein [uncultured Cohaesibacter sp.]|uniref:outer membrane protein assembly factor BamB family protein n=1 Tax=uncultured Cohaesibacter sp. TaxID=1002546 RepID=UPI0029C8EA50|nr:PQQ-binding-like beta-propeller repeat protein [uncultured Cohaesibacter sp.]
MNKVTGLHKETGYTRASLAAAVLLAGLLAGCASMSDVADTVNPFKEKETILPGERQSVFSNADTTGTEDTSPVSISGSVDFTSWGQAGGPLTNNPPNVSYSGQGARVWSVNAAIRGGDEDARAGARPVSVGGRVAVYSPDGDVSVYNANSGGKIWSVSVRPENEKGIALGGAVAMDTSRVLAATGFSQLVALEGGSGRRLWTFQLDAPARGAPVIVGDRVLAVTATNSIYAVNISDGTELWSFNGIPEGAGLVGAASPAVSGDTVLFTGTSGEMVALNLKTGEMKWSDTVVQGSRRYAVSGIYSIAGGPVVDDGVAYVSSVSGRTVAFRVKDGDRLWERSIGASHGPVVSGNSLFVLDLDDRVFALNRKDGRIRWSTQLPSIREKKKRSSWAGPVLAGGRLWFASSEGQLAGVDATTGKISVNRDNKDPVYIAPIAVGGRLITLSGSGRLSGYN